jgi:hypothetical protein
VPYSERIRICASRSLRSAASSIIDYDQRKAADWTCLIVQDHARNSREFLARLLHGLADLVKILRGTAIQGLLPFAVMSAPRRRHGTERNGPDQPVVAFALGPPSPSHFLLIVNSKPRCRLNSLIASRIPFLSVGTISMYISKPNILLAADNDIDQRKPFAPLESRSFEVVSLSSQPSMYAFPFPPSPLKFLLLFPLSRLSRGEQPCHAADLQRYNVQYKTTKSTIIHIYITRKDDRRTYKPRPTPRLPTPERDRAFYLVRAVLSWSSQGCPRPSSRATQLGA